VLTCICSIPGPRCTWDLLNLVGCGATEQGIHRDGVTAVVYRFRCAFNLRAHGSFSSYISFGEDSRATLVDLTICVGSVPSQHLSSFHENLNADGDQSGRTTSTCILLHPYQLLTRIPSCEVNSNLIKAISFAQSSSATFYMGPKMGLSLNHWWMVSIDTQSSKRGRVSNGSIFSESASLSHGYLCRSYLMCLKYFQILH
jgi:hypothetical protein